MPFGRIFLPIAILAAAGLIAGAALVLERITKPIDSPPLYTDEGALPVITNAGQSATVTESTTTAMTQAYSNGYRLVLSDDTLYVYRYGAAEPDESHRISAQWLPEYDRILLQNGLNVATTEELRQLLEDYTS